MARLITSSVVFVALAALLSPVVCGAAAFLGNPIHGISNLPALGSSPDAWPGLWLSWWANEELATKAMFFVGTLAALAAIAFLSWLSSGSLSRKEEGGVLGDAKVLSKIGEVRRASDKWDGVSNPEGSGLVYGFDGKYFLYEANAPHTATIAGSGGGKSRGSGMQTIHLSAAADCNIVASDVKNEQIELMGDGLEAQGYKTLLLDTSKPARSNRYNMLSLVIHYAERGNLQDAEQAAETIAKAIVPNDDKSSPHWANSARGLLVAVILYVILADECPKEKKHMATVARIIMEGTEGEKDHEADKLKELLRPLPYSHPSRGAASQFLGLGGGELRSVVSSLKEPLRIYNSQAIAWMVSGDEIDPVRVLTEKTALFMHVMEEGSPYNAIYAVFLDQLYKAVYLVADANGGKLPRRTNLVLDELGNMPDGTMDTVANLTTLGRSYGVRAFCIFQTWGQIKNEATRKKIQANCAVIATMGALTEPDDQNYFSNAVGKTTKETGSRNRSTNTQSNNVGTSENLNETADYVIHPWEWRERNAYAPIKDGGGSIVIKAANSSMKKSHIGVLNARVMDITKTPAKDVYHFGTEEEEREARMDYQRRLDAKAASHDLSAPIWEVEWPAVEPSEEEKDRSRPNDEWSAYDSY